MLPCSTTQTFINVTRERLNKTKQKLNKQKKERVLTAFVKINNTFLIKRRSTSICV